MNREITEYRERFISKRLNNASDLAVDLEFEYQAQLSSDRRALAREYIKDGLTPKQAYEKACEQLPWNFKSE